MAKQCQISKRSHQTGHNVSHSKRRTKRRMELNLQRKKYWNPLKKRWVRLRITTKMIKTISKKGLLTVLKKYK